MIVVTGATGKLGQLVLENLLQKRPPGEIAAAARSREKAAHWAERGIAVREADYARPDTLARAFAGAEKVLLVSSSEVGQRVPQHRAAVDAARAAGVKLLLYTSILRADTSGLILAQEHKQTEEYMRTSGLPFVFLRNGWYMENYTGSLADAAAHGAILGAAGEGRIAAAARADYAAAAAEALTGQGHENKTYELAGDQPFTLSELARESSRQIGKPVEYHNLDREAYAQALEKFGLPAPLAAAIADADAGAARGELDEGSRTLSRLIGRPTTTLADAVAAVSRVLPEALPCIGGGA